MNDSTKFPVDGFPDELASLADQLGAEANFLAELYPPKITELLIPEFLPAPEAASPLAEKPDQLLRPMPRWMRWTAAAAVVFCVAWGTLEIAEERPLHVELVGPSIKVVEHQPSPVRRTPTVVQPTMDSRHFYDNLTTPAREALLDLWEAESVEQASFSI